MRTLEAFKMTRMIRVSAVNVITKEMEYMIRRIYLGNLSAY